jgi:G3E family GTPase
MHHNDRRLPVFVVTGFLGSGKTTMLRTVLADPRLSSAALIVNEFGTVSLDHHLLRTATERVSLIGGGCACCQVREDLVAELKGLLDAHETGRARISAVILETTGLADPAPIIFTILTDPVLQHHFSIAGIYVTVDAVHGSIQLDHHVESLKQVLLADKLILTKIDLVEPETVAHLSERLRSLNPTAELLTAAHGLSADDFLRLPHLIRTHAPKQPVSLDTGSHVVGTETVSIRFDGAIEWAQFVVWLSLLLHAYGECVLRVKGMIDMGTDGPVVLQGVQHVIHPPEHLATWPISPPQSTLTFILRGIPSESLLNSLRVFATRFGGDTAFSVA